MKKLMNRFVVEYKAVLKMKNNAEKSPYVSRIQFLTGSFILLFTIATFVFMFDLHQNLHFILLSSNLYLVGSFLLYLWMKETINKFINKLEYDTYFGLILDLVWFITCLSIFNTLIYYLLLNSYVAIQLIIFNIITGIFGILVYSTLKSMTYDDTTNFDVVIVSTWCFSLFYGIYTALGISTVIYGYICSLLALIILVFLKSNVPKYLLMVNKQFYEFLGLSLIIGFLLLYDHESIGLRYVAIYWSAWIYILPITINIRSEKILWTFI